MTMQNKQILPFQQMSIYLRQEININNGKGSSN